MINFSSKTFRTLAHTTVFVYTWQATQPELELFIELNGDCIAVGNYSKDCLNLFLLWENLVLTLNLSLPHSWLSLVLLCEIQTTLHLTWGILAPLQTIFLNSGKVSF